MSTVADLKEMLREIYRSLAEGLSRHWVKLLLAVLVVSLGFYLSEYMVPLILLISTAIISILTTRLELNQLGIEIATFSTVLMGAFFGPRTGALLGLVFILVQLFSGGSPGMYIIWVIPGYVLAGHLAGIFSEVSIVLLGVSLSLGLQSFFLFCTTLLMREGVARYFQYSVFNVAFNALLFTALGPRILELLGVAT